MIFEFLYISLAFGYLVTFPLLIYNEWHSHVEGHRVVTCGAGLFFFIVSAIPVMNFILACIAVYNINVVKISAFLEKPMFKETK